MSFRDEPTKAKLKYGFEQAFLNQATYILPAVTTVRQMWRENTPNKSFSDDFADGLSRYAINFGTSSSKALFTSGIYPALFKQNPHYEPSHKTKFAARLIYATSRVFIACGDNGSQQFNSSRMAGMLTASTLANIWERNTLSHNRIGIGPTFHRFGFMLAGDIVRSILFKEFGPDIKRKLLRR